MSAEIESVTLTSESGGFFGQLFDRARAIGTIRVDAEALCNALKAALPHADKNSSFEQLGRVHFRIEGQLFVVATDRYSLGIVRVADPDLIDYDGDVWGFSLLVEDATFLASLFKPDKNEQITVELSATNDKLYASDVSGLFKGREIVMPNFGCWDGVESLFERMRTEVMGDVLDDGGSANAFGPSRLKRFSASAAALSEIVVHFERRKGALGMFVRIGAYFIGSLTINRAPDPELEREEHRGKWLAALPLPDVD